MDKKEVTPVFRVRFPSVFKATVFQEGDEPKYSIVMLYGKDEDLSSLREIVNQARIKKWGEEIPIGYRNPLRNGDEKAYKGFAGTTYVRASSKRAPGVVDKKLNPIANHEKFYSGCYAKASVTAFAYDNKGNKGVSIILHNIQKVADGEPLDGRSSPEEDFEVVVIDEGSADNSEIYDEEGI